MTHQTTYKHCKVDESEWPQILAIITASLATLSGGIFFAWPSPSIPILISDSYPIDITLEEASYLTIIPAIAVIIFSPLSGTIIDILGRRNSLLFIAIPQLISWALIGNGGSIYIFYIARFLNGLSDSCAYAAVPCYISEVSTPKIRCTWGNAITFCRFLGFFLMYLVGTYLSIRVTSYVFAVIPMILILLALFLPETPYFLIMKGHEEKARKSLQWLRRKHDVDEELKQLTADVSRQLSEPGRFKDLFTIRNNRKAVFIGGIFRGAQQYSGISAIIMYTQIIFEKSGSNMSAGLSAIIVSGFLVIGNFTTSCILDKIGKRIPMIVSCLGSSITLALLTIFFCLHDNTDINLESYNLLPLIVMILYILFYSVGLGIIPVSMLGELFSFSIKGKGLCIINTFYGIYISTSSLIFSNLLVEYGIFAPFGFFAICNFLSAITSYYYVQETNGKTLEEIQQDLKSNVKKVRY